ncbi:MAG TPA: ABC transporter transmembrane domain-containing protein, partial [Beijerinckiaceae bacterium]|nr:ABC transporter transmembrane domain-containing protein [Beijerinckiaceae bacterium]
MLIPSASDAEPAPRTSLKALSPLLPYGLRYKGLIAAALLALTMAAIATLAVPLAVRRMIDFGFSKQSPGLIDAYFAAMAAVAAVLALASGARYFLVTTIGERVVADLRADLFKHLTRLDASFYDTAKIGELLSRLTADTTQMKAAFGASASVALRNLFLFVGAIGMMVYTSPKLSAYVLIAIPVIVLPLFAAGRSVRGRTRAAQDRLADASAYAAENLSAIRTMQAFNAEASTIARFTRAVEEAYGAARSAISARAVLTTVAIFLAFGSVVAVLWLGAKDVLAGRMSGGLLSQFVLYAVLGASALGQLSEVWSEISAAAGAAGRIAEILQVQPTITRPQVPARLPEPPKGEIEFRDVSFENQRRAGEPVLHDLSFRIAPGETVAIVGPSGAGKT